MLPVEWPHLVRLCDGGLQVLDVGTPLRHGRLLLRRPRLHTADLRPQRFAVRLSLRGVGGKGGGGLVAAAPSNLCQ